MMTSKQIHELTEDIFIIQGLIVHLRNYEVALTDFVLFTLSAS